MTDYKNLKLIASSSPHIRSNEDTRSIMLDVIIALLPALAWSVYCFGWKALLLTAVSVVSCVFFEWAYRKVMKKSCMVGDLSAVVTGILLSFVCPVDLPWWVIIIGAFFSIVVVKRHRLQLPEPRAGGPCVPAGQLCHMDDHLGHSPDPSRCHLRRHPHDHYEGGHRGGVHHPDEQLLHR